MPFKTLRLKRTNTFYPTAGRRRNLIGLLKNLTLTPDALEDILELEDADFVAGQPGVESRELEVLLHQAQQQLTLPDSERARIYFHILRQGKLPKIKSQPELDVLLLAYQQLNHELHRGYPIVILAPLMGLVIFGVHGEHNCTDKPLGQLALPLSEYHRRLNAWQKASSYTAIPNMLEKPTRFQAFSNDTALIAYLLQVLQTCHYQHHNVNPDYPEAYPTTYLPFWGLVFMVLLNPHFGSQVVDDFHQLNGSLPQFDQHWAILQRFIEATQC